MSETNADNPVIKLMYVVLLEQAIEFASGKAEAISQSVR